MVRALWFILKIAILAAGAIWIAERPGTVEIDWQGYTLHIHFGFFCLVLALTLLFALLLFRVLSFLFGLPRKATGFRKENLRRKGELALTRGMVAVAAGDTALASRYAKEARGRLPDDKGLVLLLEAQAARMRGDREAAGQALQGLLGNKDTAFFGVRGLMQAALETGETDKALTYAHKAQEMYPRQPWILKITYELQLRNRDWVEAEKTLKKAERTGAVPKDKARSDRAVLFIARGDDNMAEGLRMNAGEMYKKAHKLDPLFLPAALRLVAHYIADGKRRSAISVLEKAWKAGPHPEMVPLWDKVAPKNKPGDPMVRLRWFERLLALKPDSAEGQMAVARAAMDDGLWGEARAYLKQAEKIRPGAGLYRLWAELEEKSTHDMDAVRGWLEKAADAPAGKVWTCRETGRIYESWSPVAQPHGAFNTIEWGFPQPVSSRAPELSMPDSSLIAV